MTIQDAQPFLHRAEGYLASIAAATAMTASGHKLGFVFDVVKAGTVTKVLFRTGTISGTCSVDVRLETVSSGKPSGTLLATNSNATQGSLASNTTYEVTLTASATLTQGQQIAVVIAYSAGTSIVVNVNSTSSVFSTSLYPGTYLDTGSGYTQISNRSPCFALGYNDSTYNSGAGCIWAIAAASSGTYSSGEKGLRFRLPMKTRVCGLWHSFDPDTTLTFNLYADATAPAGTALVSRAITSADFKVANSSPSPLLFTSSYTLDANTWYRLVCSVAAASTRFQYIDVGANARAAATPFGTDHYLTESSGGSWVDTNTRIPLMGLIIDGLDDGAGGGSSLILPNNQTFAPIGSF